MLAKNPGFTAVAIIALALGIGANSAIFSVVNAVLLRPLPYERPERLVMLWENNPALQLGFDLLPVSAANFTEWRGRGQSFEEVSAFDSVSFNLTGADTPDQIGGARVSANFFKLLGVQPERGRAFLPEEDQPGNNRVIVISHSLWENRFGSDPNIIGRTMTLNDTGYTVVGIMPKDFGFPKATDLPSYFQLPPQIELWAPLALTREIINSRGNHNYAVMARLKPGVTLEQAQSEMTAIASGLEQQSPFNAGWGVTIVPLHEQAVGSLRLVLLVLAGAVGFVLLIACANIANLLLARAASRQKEIAIRTALGASRSRIVRQLLTESVLLALAGGTLGILLTLWGIDLLLALSPANLPRIKEVNIDAWVLGFTLAVSLATGIAFGLAPALQVSKANLNEFLKDGARGSTSGIRAHRVRNLLVMSEVALTLVLLICAGLLARSFIRLMSVDAGFNPRNVITMRVNLPQNKYPERRDQTAFFKQVISRVETLPGVQTVGAVSHLPLSGAEESGNFSIEGRPPVDPKESPIVNLRAISPGYFQAMEIPLLKGRDFTEQDNDQSPYVAIISESLARRFFPDEDPIGQRVKRGSASSTLPWATIVGIVADIKHSALDAEPKPHLYFSYLQNPFPYLTLVVRSATSPEGLAAALRSEVWAVDKDQPVTAITTMERYLSEAMATRRFNMILLGVFAIVALVLAAVGIYGVISYSVTQRTHEIGVRMALGASSGDVMRLIVGQAMTLAAAGVAAGLVAAFALTRVMESLLFGVSSHDVITFIAIPLVLGAVALAACLVPARRATKVDPMVALRYE
jgi:putative ABC transport system permease protein